MNTTLTQRLASITFAAMLTLGMLLGVNGLAVSEVSEAQLARVTAQQPA
jgi:hypothetical protein